MLVLDSADCCAAEVIVTDENVRVELSGGQDSIPRHLREAVILTGVCKESEEVAEADWIVEEDVLTIELGRL